MQTGRISCPVAGWGGEPGIPYGVEAKLCDRARRGEQRDDPARGSKLTSMTAVEIGRLTNVYRRCVASDWVTSAL